MLNTGQARCWGNNGRGQLGNGTTIDSSAPAVVGGATALTVEGLAPDEAERHLRSVLPDGVIGAHAMTHLRIADVLRSDWDILDHLPTWRDRQAEVEAARVELLGLVADAALRQSVIRLLHQVLKQHSLRSQRIRTEWPRSRHAAPAFPSIEAQDRYDLVRFGFQRLPWVHTDLHADDRLVTWWRPLRGDSDRDAWVRAYARCGHAESVDRMLADLDRFLCITPNRRKDSQARS